MLVDIELLVLEVDVLRDVLVLLVEILLLVLLVDIDELVEDVLILLEVLDVEVVNPATFSSAAIPTQGILRLQMSYRRWYHC